MSDRQAASRERLRLEADFHADAASFQRQAERHYQRHGQSELAEAAGQRALMAELRREKLLLQLQDPAATDPPAPQDVAEHWRRLAIENHRLQLRAADLRIALESNRRIAMACGVVMATCNLTGQQAFERLNRISQSTNRKLRDLAEEVLLNGELRAPARLTRPSAPASDADATPERAEG